MKYSNILATFSLIFATTVPAFAQTADDSGLPQDIPATSEPAATEPEVDAEPAALPKIPLPKTEKRRRNKTGPYIDEKHKTNADDNEYQAAFAVMIGEADTKVNFPNNGMTYDKATNIAGEFSYMTGTSVALTTRLQFRALKGKATYRYPGQSIPDRPIKSNVAHFDFGFGFRPMQARRIRPILEGGLVVGLSNIAFEADPQVDAVVTALKTPRYSDLINYGYYGRAAVEVILYRGHQVLFNFYYANVKTPNAPVIDDTLNTATTVLSLGYSYHY